MFEELRDKRKRIIDILATDPTRKRAKEAAESEDEGESIGG